MHVCGMRRPPRVRECATEMHVCGTNCHESSNDWTPPSGVSGPTSSDGDHEKGYCEGYCAALKSLTRMSGRANSLRGLLKGHALEVLAIDCATGETPVRESRLNADQSLRANEL